MSSEKAMIRAHIPVEKVWRTAHTYTYRQEEMMCEVVRILRRPCGSQGAARSRYYYEAIIKLPVAIPSDYPRLTQEEGLFRVNVIRAANPKWKPPVFPNGQDVVEVSAAAAQSAESGREA